jgi:hypothetical protein
MGGPGADSFAERAYISNRAKEQEFSMHPLARFIAALLLAAAPLAAAKAQILNLPSPNVQNIPAPYIPAPLAAPSPPPVTNGPPAQGFAPGSSTSVFQSSSAPRF